MIMGIVLSACVPKVLYVELKEELEISRNQKTQYEEKIKSLEAERNQLRESLQRMEVELKDLEEIRKKYHKDVSDLQAQYALQKNINEQLSKNNQKLKQDLNKKKSVIQLQEKVIRLLDDTKRTIETSLKDQIATQDIEVVEFEDKLKVVFVDKILFDTGSFEINPKGKDLLLIVAESLKNDTNQNILVEGHTDNIPVGPALRKRFPSNWELSTARAAAVVRFLQEKGRIKPERLSALGYSSYRPVAPNNSPTGRHQNRRIEIILSLPE
jgi:chemotaxis protein MotB